MGENMKRDRSTDLISPKRQILVLGGLVVSCAALLVVSAIWAGPAMAKQKYADATGEDCKACHVDADSGNLLPTRQGQAFKNGGCLTRKEQQQGVAPRC
jgi:hypothetical protein